jgi:hypothetical protein
MLDQTGDWCFEGGCTFLADSDMTTEEQADTAELETLYREPCIGMYD